MEYDSNENGLQNLNPMYLWKFVRQDKTRTQPRVIVQVEKEQEILELANQNHEWEFVIISDTLWDNTNLPNIKIVWGSSLRGEQLYRLYASADFVLSDIDNPEQWLPAMFCGATPLYSLDQLKEQLIQPRVLTLVERIENWETAGNTLTFLTTSGIKEV